MISAFFFFQRPILEYIEGNVVCFILTATLILYLELFQFLPVLTLSRPKFEILSMRFEQPHGDKHNDIFSSKAKIVSNDFN